MKTNITLKLDSELIREAKILAAQQGSSVSALLARKLEDMVRRQRDYEEARRSALAQLEKGYDLHWAPPKSRDELYER
jgi:predicted transcriptional regulator